MSKLIHASKSNPCPICTKTGWCYELSDTLWCCKRSDSAPPDWVRTTKQDSDGAWYFAIENDLNSDDRAAKKEEWERLKAEREANQREVQQQEFKTQLTAVQRDPLIRALSQKLGLSSQHCQMLRERGLTDEQIKAGLFFSIPSWQEVSNRYPLNLPGIKQTNDGKRFVATTKDESTGKYVGGIAIVAIDASGWATGWQLMSVPRIEDKKYTWALGEKSSHLPIGNGELPIQVVGTATNPDTAWGCEGLLKSFVASGRINDRFIGASSGLFRSSPSGTKTALEGVKTIKLTVDAGDAINPQRVRHWRLETEFFQSLGLTVLFPWWGQTTKEQNDIDELTADEFKAIAYLTPDRFFEMAELEESKLEDGKAFIKNNQEDDHTHLLQRELGHLLEVKGKKAPAIFQGDLYKSLSSAANNFNIPVEILVFCLLPILSSRIPSETRLLINPGTNYLVPALRWNALVGETGTKKSPVLKALLAPLLNIQKQIAAKYKEQKDIYDKEYGIWKAEKVKGRGEEPTLPAPMLDCYFSDFTIESIGQSISDHSDNSYLVFVDELAGFFKSMDAYRKAGGDRQKWLDLYNAGALKINRKGSPTIFCPHTSVSLLGGLQPSILEQMIKTDESSEDGLWNRFMFCRLPQAKTAAFSHNSISLFDCLSSLYLNLAAAKPIEHKLSDAAKPLWEAWHDAIEERIMTETSELVRGTYAKVEGVAGRNALIIHRVTAAQQGAIPDTCISGEVMQMAIEWTQWELGQTLLEYQRLGLTEDPELSRILRFIDKFEGKGWVNAIAVRSWWSGKVKPPVQEIRSFMTKVVTLGYAIDNGESPTSGKYQILIDRKGSHVSHVLPEDGSQQSIDSVTTLSHEISHSGDETATESHIQNMTNGSHKVSHVLDNCSTSRTESDAPECLLSNMTKIVTNGSHPSEPTQLRHPVDLPDQNMTNGSHESKSLPVKDYSEKVTNMTTFSKNENTSESANIESLLPPVITNLVTNTPRSSNDMDLGAVTSSGNSPNMAINGHHSDSDDDLVISSGNRSKASFGKASKPLVTTVTTRDNNKNLIIGDRVQVKGTEIEGEITGWTKNRAEAWLQLDDGEITKNYASKDLMLVQIKDRDLPNIGLNATSSKTWTTG